VVKPYIAAHRAGNPETEGDMEKRAQLIAVLAGSLLVASLAGCSHSNSPAVPGAAPTAQPAAATATRPATSQNTTGPEIGYAQESQQQRMMDSR